MTAEIGDTAGYMLVEQSKNTGIWYLISSTRYPTISEAVTALKAATDGYTIGIPTGVAKLSLVMIQHPEEARE